MKVKLLITVLLFYNFFSLFSQNTLVYKVAGQYTSIPDRNFEDMLITLGLDSGQPDGQVLTANINTTISLELADLNISNLTGIEGFTSLKELYCSDNNLTQLDVSKNINLTLLDCSNNQLTTLDLTKNTALKILNLHQNQLTTIDVSKNNNLDNFVCRNNRLTFLDVSKNGKLGYLDCSYNQLTNLSLRNTLYSMDCGNNKLTTLDLSKITGIGTLRCDNNNLIGLDFSKNKALKRLACNNNRLISLNLKNGKNTIITNIYMDSNPDLHCIKVDDVNYSNANWAGIKDTWATYELDCSPDILPSNNFTIESRAESCVDANNGEINITANTSYPYEVKINGTSYAFINNSLKVSDLIPGSYSITISIPEAGGFSQNFTVKILEAVSITSKSTWIDNKVTLEISKGTAPYTVLVDGIQQFETTSSYFSVDLKGGDFLEVKTAKACEGSYIQAIPELLSAYPNPTEDYFEIKLLTIKQKEIAIGIYTSNGELVSQKKYSIKDGKIQLSLNDQPKGLYIIKVELDTPKYLKIIKN